MESLPRQERQLLELKECPELGAQTLEMLCATGKANPAYMDAAGKHKAEYKVIKPRGTGRAVRWRT